ncbi:MAG: cation:dicarboxylase symporter family transporter [Hyphomonadaceae bacterium]|nr:cation:dicarboxylase symporter family transporter [Hyphomonadaceae bacterium]
MTKLHSLFVLAGLVAGLGAGAAIHASGDATLEQASPYVEAFGGLWLNALRMTVIPLIVALLITGVASVADAAKTGGLVARFVLLFSVLLFGAAIYSVLFTQSILSAFPVDRAAADAFLQSVSGEAAPAQAPSFSQWLQSLAPSNPVRAAAEDQVLPLVVFALFFGFAATRIAPALRTLVIDFFRAVAETMVVVVHWVLLAGPFGVFALALGLGRTAGFEAAGVLAHYVLVVAGAIFGITIVGVLLALSWGRQPVGRYFAATAPVWAIAMSTQSSIASLPAMLEAARGGLRIPERIADIFLPLAVAVFRFTSPVGNLAVVLFIAHLFGFEPSFLQLASAVFVSYGVSIGAVGLPGQVSFITSIAPIGLALGVPIELLGILIAVEVFPDIFRTLGNCAGDLAITSILSRGERSSG